MKFLVIGDSCIDKFIYGKCERICPEAPVPVFNPVKEKINGGMAANVQANIQALGVDCDIITHANQITKTRYVDIKTNQMLLRVDEDDKAVGKFDYKTVDYKHYDAILVSDYGKGFVNGLSDIKSLCLEHDNVFLDSNKLKLTMDLPQNLRFLKINEYELEANPHLRDHLVPKPHQNEYHTRPDQIIVTRGHKGCDYMGKRYTPPSRVVTQDLSGAGDTFMAALAVSIMKVNDAEMAINFANKCACEVVSKRGVVTV